MKARVYLVDDEQPVLDGLAVTLRKFMSEVEICGTSRSARTAVEGIAREKPDLVLMDVRMPGMSGLDALREVRRLSPDTLPILLTAYERFDIAREAFSLGVYDYLVKPVEQEVLVRTIRGALALLAARKEAALRAVAARDELELARPLLEAGFVYEALLGSRGGLLASYAQRLGLPSAEPIAGLFAAVGRRAHAGEASGAVTAEDAAAFRAAIAYRLSCIVGAPIGGVLPVFVDRLDAANAEEALAEALAAVEDRLLRASLGPLKESGALAESWSEALRGFSCDAAPEAAPEAAHDAARPGIASDGAAVDLAASPGGRSADGTDLADADLADAALAAASRSDAAAAAAAFARWAEGGRRGALERAALAGALAAAAGGLSAHAISAAAAQAAAGDLSGDGADRAAALLAVALAAIAPAPDAEEALGADRRVRVALHFIAERYGEAISLEEAAERAGVSPAHLSRLLVATTGSSFTEHLTARRIERARAELTEGSRSIKEIAALCGYLDANYFSRAFKKAVGLTPSEYGNRHGRSIL